MIKFSICIPNYNYANYIGETIESVLGQTYPHFEIIIVDNASTDNSWEEIERFTASDSRVIAYRNNYNVGFSHNLDEAVTKSNNPFILVLSSDDKMKPNALEVYTKIIESIDFIEIENVLICSSTDVIDSYSRLTGKFKKNNFHNLPSELHKQFNDSDTYYYDGRKLLRDILPRFSVPGPFNSTLFSRKLYEKVNGYSSINLVGPDAFFAYKCMFEGANVVFYNKELFQYRIHGSGQLNQLSKKLSLNLLIDRYVFCNSFTNQQLQSINLTKDSLQYGAFYYDVFKGGIVDIKNGQLIYALRKLLFAVAAYPKVVLNTKEFYALLFILLLGPLGYLGVNLLFYLRRA